MKKELYINEISDRLVKTFQQVKAGVKVPEREKFRLEGFLQGAVFMEFLTQSELNQLIESLYKEVHGKTIEQRRTELQNKDKDFDEDYYDTPTIFRLGRFID